MAEKRPKSAESLHNESFDQGNRERASAKLGGMSRAYDRLWLNGMEPLKAECMNNPLLTYPETASDELSRRAGQTLAWRESARYFKTQLHAEPGEIRNVAQLAERAQVIVGDDAFDYFVSHSTVRHSLDEQQRHRVTPTLDWGVLPTLRTFTRDAPAWIEISNKAGLRFAHEAKTFGALIYELPIDDPELDLLRDNYPGAERAVVLHLFCEPKPGNRLAYLGEFYVANIPTSTIVLRSERARPFVDVIGINDIQAAADETIQLATDYRNGLIGEIAFHVLGVNSLMHCRNVRVDDVEPAAKLSDVHRKKFAKKSEARGLEPFRRVNLSAFRRELEEQARAAGNADVSLHFVRPHFAHYGGVDPATGRERGLLFGKTEGVFFRPLRIAGNPERGVATKEYHVSDAPDDVIAAGLNRLRKTDQQHQSDLGRSSDV